MVSTAKQIAQMRKSGKAQDGLEAARKAINYYESLEEYDHEQLPKLYCEMGACLLRLKKFEDAGKGLCRVS